MQFCAPPLVAAALLTFCSLVIADLAGKDCIYEIASNGANSRLCVGRAQVVEVGQNVSLDLTWNSNPTFSINLDVHVEHHHVATFLPQITIKNGNGELVLIGIKAGRSIVSLECTENATIEHLNSSCPLSEESLYFLKREVSIVNSLLLDVITLIVGWTYTILWVISYYPQKYYSCKRGSVAGLNFDFVGICFTSAVAYLTFNISLVWIPQVQEEYFRRHPEGVNPVQLNDVAFSLSSTFSIIVWIAQCFILKREGQKMGCAGAVFIAMLWLLILTSVVMGAVGFLTWLDSLYIISYTTLISAPVKYLPMIWSNFRRKSTEGFSPYSTMLSLVGGLFSVLQMFMLAYNYDDWKSIFGDPTKFGFGLITVGFEIIHFLQHCVVYRGARMKKYKLSIECTCEPGCCKCKAVLSRRRSSAKLCDTVALPDDMLELKSIAYV